VQGSHYCTGKYVEVASVTVKLFAQTESHSIKFDHHIKGVPYTAVIFLLMTVTSEDKLFGD